MASLGMGEVVEFGPFQLHLQQRKLFCASDEVQLGSRAMDVLLALARNRGELVSKEQLFETVWPNAYVHESNLKVTVGSLRRTLREWCESSEYINTVVGRGYWLGTDSRLSKDLAESPPLLASTLPEIGTIIGRDTAIAQLRDTLTQHRLTTLVGAGGIGKTTVAVAAAQLFEDDGGGSVTFVDFGRVASEEFVPASLAAALGITSHGIESSQAIVSILAKRKGLLLLDTCEHVRSAVAHMCDIVLANAPQVRILATSREVLRARHEKVMWLTPLDVPPSDHEHTAHSVMRYSAPQLLEARAFDKTGYRVSDADAGAIAEICRRLDGAPLALELVSSRFASRMAGIVLNELDDRFRTLRCHPSTAPLRQQTLLATLEWSYALLNQEEACVLRAISYFAGSFNIEAVTRILGHSEAASSTTFDAIAGLRAKSMLNVDQTFGELRYRLLDSTREFAIELLHSEGELAAISASHARLQLEILNRASAELVIMQGRKWRALYNGQADDLRKALDWALYRREDVLLGIQLVAAGLPLWHELSLGEETRSNCEHALAELERIGCDDKPLRLKLVVGLAAVCTYLPVEPAKTIALFETASRLAQETADISTECRVLAALATYKLLQVEGAGELLQKMQQCALRTNDRTALWEQELLTSVSEIHLGEFPAAHRRLQRLREQTQDHFETAVPRFHIHQRSNVDVQLGATSWLIGKPGEALSIIEKAAHEAMEVGHGLTLIHCLSRGIIFTLIESGYYARARFFADLLRSTIYRHGMAAWIPIADCYSACIDAHSSADSDPDGLRQAFHGLTRGQVSHQAYHAPLANAMIAIGQPDDAARVVAQVFRSGAQLWVLPEMLRIRAAIERSSGQMHDAARTLRESLQVADDIGALGWKLRAAIDLARVLRAQGSTHDAHQILAPVFGRFTDGFTAGDLIAARTLLEQLRSEH